MKRILSAAALSCALFSWTFAGGCTSEAESPTTPATPTVEGEGEHEHEHEHGETGPNGGHLIELGDYHAELTHDDDTQTVTVYILDGDAEEASPIAATEVTLNLTAAGGEPQQFQLPAAPQEGESAGASSRFELIDQDLFAAIEEESVTGRLNVTIDGEQLVGDFEHAHDHEHDHEHEEGAEDHDHDE